MLEGLKDLFSRFFWPNKGVKRSASDFSDTEDSVDIPAQKRMRGNYDGMSADTVSTIREPSVFRILDSHEFKNPLESKWRSSAYAHREDTPRFLGYGFTEKIDYLNNKENASGGKLHRRSGSYLQHLVHDVEDSYDVQRVEPRRKCRYSNVTTAARMRSVNSPAGSAPRTGAVRKPTSAARNIPINIVDSDDEVQVLDSYQPQKSNVCMRFQSDLYNLPVDSRLRSTEVCKSYIPGLRACSTKNVTANKRFAREKKQFEELIARFRINKQNRFLPISTPDRYCTAGKADSTATNIPVFTLDNEPIKEVVTVKATHEAKPTTLATKIAEGVQPPAEMIKKPKAMEEVFRSSKYYSDFLRNIQEKHLKKEREVREQLREPEIVAKQFEKQNEKNAERIQEHVRQRLSSMEIIFDDLKKEVPQLPQLTAAMMKVVDLALVPYPKSDLLVDAFSLRITRHDMQTLNGLNWLNDEVINFYMNLLIERGKDSKFPNVYAHNTFFYTRLISGGHSAVKRWTKKVDLLAQDLVVVPVHLGVHWCMACIDLRVKEIRYFDSMGNENNTCLKQLLIYLEEESKEKKKVTLDSANWKLTNMEDIPQQGNGSDCGMFACMYAEFICRNAKITFTQDDMPYLREKMVYEIMSKKLLPVPG